MTLGVTEHIVAAALAPLNGLPLWDARRTLNVVSLQFGERIERIFEGVHAKGPGLVGTYALHLQCPWRLSATTGVLTGSQDVYEPADDTVTEQELEHMTPGRMLADVELQRWFAAHTARPLCVQSVRVDRCAGFVLSLEQDFALEVFPDASPSPHDPREHWRLFQPGTEARHFVMRSGATAR